jgi:DnaK suppressor protein
VRNAEGSRCRRRSSLEEWAGIMTSVPKAVAKDDRYTELAKMLAERRHELAHAVQDRKRDARADNIKDLDVLDEGESSEADTQEEIELALLQMKTETLNKITLALERLAEGTYGSCLECGDDIAAARLRALPFAVRCKTCEEARESAEQLERIVAQRRQSSVLAFDVSR